ncbi:hypothetical protein C2G38_2189393 [Gigaspora rosea]|uniref:Uncharacterized protein n=1 Tax=Gigaspora rosea TaxID=44941 RepID=A0A397V2F5_9GLOM|nr:hypothetical protein C2G38_2189393 [Gigaspora rosea]
MSDNGGHYHNTDLMMIMGYWSEWSELILNTGNGNNTLLGNSNWFEWQWPTTGEFVEYIKAQDVPSMGKWKIFTVAELDKLFPNEINYTTFEENDYTFEANEFPLNLVGNINKSDRYTAEDMHNELIQCAKDGEIKMEESLLFDELPQDDINKDQLDIGYSSKTSKKILFKDINFSNPVQNINLENNIVNLFNNNNLSENLADMFFELENNTYSKNFEVDSNTNILDEFENTSQDYHELSDDISVSADYF